MFGAHRISQDPDQPLKPHNLIRTFQLYAWRPYTHYAIRMRVRKNICSKEVSGSIKYYLFLIWVTLIEIIRSHWDKFFPSRVAAILEAMLDFLSVCRCASTHLCLASYKRDICKQCRPRSDAAKRGVWSESTLFPLNTGISIKYGINKN